MSTSFVARSIFEKMRQEFPDYLIKFSSDHPRNPANQAGPEEQAMIRYFTDHPEIDKWSGETELNGRPYLAHFSARRMKERCLRCHGRPEDAPASLVQRYGTTAGFRWPVGEVVALDTVAIPMDKTQGALVAGTLSHSALMAGGIALLALTSALLFRVIVARRLAAMEAHFGQLAAQPENAPITPMEARGRDEISSLARRFNALADKVHAAHASLEQQVRNRTADLREANETLRCEIDERKRAQETLASAHAELDQIFEGAADAMRVVDTNFNVLRMNETFLSLSGLDRAEVTGCKCYEVFSSPLCHTPDCPLTRILGGEKGLSFEIEKQGRNGRRIPCIVTATPFCGPDGELIGIVEDCKDITGRKRAEEELRDSNAAMVEALAREKRAAMELEAAMGQLEAAKQDAEAATRSKSEFLANMSHEIRTPMTAILGFADVLLEYGNLESAPPERIEAARTIKRNGEYLLGIINDILDLSKIEAGKLMVERIACSPCRIVDEVTSLVRVPAEAKGLPFGIEYVGALPETIQTDPTRLRQILINLIGNAIKFTETGGVRLVVRLAGGAGAQGATDPMGKAEPASSPGEPAIPENLRPFLQFDVVDTGLGMTEEQVAKLFQPFTQADTSTTRRFGGTGLGLTISKRFAKKLGGDITLVETSEGLGTRFRLTIATGPLDGVRMIEDPMSATTVTADATETRANADQPDLHDRCVLLAEDGPDNQRLIAHVLRRAGAEVTVTKNGKLAAAAALAARDEGKPFDVILMDMQMPVMDGYAATSLLRQKGYTGLIIALTAHAMEGDREKCLDAGCDDYVSKPIDREKLIAAIQESRQRRRSPHRTKPAPGTDRLCNVAGSAIDQRTSR